MGMLAVAGLAVVLLPTLSAIPTGQPFGGTARLWQVASDATAVDPEYPTPALACPVPSEDLLAAISRERALLAEQRQAHEAERETLLLARAAAAEDMARLQALKSEIEGFMSAIEVKRSEDLKRMVAVYEAMKPEEAARLLDDMDMGITLEIFSVMSERKAAAILARISAPRARTISRVLLEISRLPADRNLEGLALK
jgi:flagellar motility protein MotE (MotC chaperone)